MLGIANPLFSLHNITGAILAGGKGDRMGGTHKALLPFHSERLIHRQISRLKQLCTEIIIVTNEPFVYAPIVDRNIRIITDYYSNNGPLAGMHAALSLAYNDHVWIIGCDMPFVSTDAAKLMLQQKERSKPEAVIPYVNGQLYPLYAVYDKSCASSIAAMLERNDMEISDFVSRLAYETTTEQKFESEGLKVDFITDVNTPDEYEAALLKDSLVEDDRTIDKRFE